jgi:hypothetical protein
MIYDRFGDGVGVVAKVVFVVISVLANMIGHDSAAIFQMDGISPCAGEGEQPYKGQLSYKEDGDT